ncbi:MAG: hypothetical protein R3F61_23110 [Myxococcota bacterium]
MTASTPENPRDAIGLREDELPAADRDALQALLSSDPEARREHDEARILGQTLGALPGMSGGPSAAEVLARARAAKSPPARARWPIVALVAAAAAVVVAVGLQGDGQRARGVSTPDAAVRLEAVADGPAVRALSDGAGLQAGEAVVFHVTTTRSGVLTLVEHGPHGANVVQRWAAQPGRHALGGDRPLAWTPDDPAGGDRRYVVEWCDEEGAGCIEDALQLHWSPR